MELQTFTPVTHRETLDKLEERYTLTRAQFDAGLQVRATMGINLLLRALGIPHIKRQGDALDTIELALQKSRQMADAAKEG